MWKFAGPSEPSCRIAYLDEVGIPIAVIISVSLTYLYSHMADEATALYITRHDHYGLGTGKKANAELDTRHLGPKVILMDMWRAQGWDILTHGGFVTYFHYDASGFITFIFPRSGSKIWAYSRLKEERSPKNRNDLFNLFDELLDETRKTLSDSFVMGTILIEEGDIL